MSENILEYKNANVVEAFCKRYSVEESDANDIFEQMLKWFVFCTDKKSSGFRNIDDSTLIIDEMWHTFILFTVDYSDFCRKYVGYYLHHQPSTNAELVGQRKRTLEEVRTKKKTQYELVYDILGKETFIKWYHEYPERYSLDKISKLSKNPFE
ncbi:hypothetical protein L2755_07790 [Shewanella abyssi]|uniref:hypothetical protein n=1 Tax=Shewanella abyssi TaxID=311789 RepID=UPI00200CFF25|nr:hypothetical protein [Shewanella abyssi]MCL1049518.1 hypothetical protein [Shewanella abyssi]